MPDHEASVQIFGIQDEGSTPTLKIRISHDAAETRLQAYELICVATKQVRGYFERSSLYHYTVVEIRCRSRQTLQRLADHLRKVIINEPTLALTP